MYKSLVDTIKDLYVERKIEVSEPEEKKLKKIVKSLNKSVKAHGDQAKSLEKSIIDKKSVNELSKDTLRSYIKKASDAQKHKGLPISKVDKRYSGVHKADKKINKEEGFGPRSRGRKVGYYPKPKPVMPKVNEISTDTKKMYVHKATKDIADRGIDLGMNLAKDNPKPSKTAMDRILKRRKGITKAVKSMTKNERKLTKPELKGREKVAKDLPDAEFKKRYGDNWMAVKMATATNIAKKKY